MLYVHIGVVTTADNCNILSAFYHAMFELTNQITEYEVSSYRKSITSGGNLLINLPAFL